MSTPPVDPAPPRSPSPVLRWIVLLVAIAETVFLGYAIYYIISHANPQGDGMEIVAIGPMAVIFLIFTLPALLLALGRRPGRTVLAAVFAVASLAANWWLWGTILLELAD